MYKRQDLSTYAGQNGFVGFQYVALRGAEVQTYGIDDIVYGEMCIRDRLQSYS